MIMSQILMPFASGTEILPAIRSFGRNSAVVILSGLIKEVVVLYAFNLPTTDFMVEAIQSDRTYTKIKCLITQQLALH